MKLTDLYLIVTEYPTHGIGSGGDVTSDLDDALDQYCEALDNDQPARVFQLHFGLELGEFRLACECTAQFDELAEARGAF